MIQRLISQYGGQNTGVTAGQTSALGNLSAAASGIPNFSGDASGAIAKLFGSSTSPQIGMLNDAFSSLKGNIGGTASGAELDPYSTPGFSDAINTMTKDITNRVKGVYAGAGRDPSGAGTFAGSLGRGLTEGIAPVIASQFNQNKSNQMNAANTLFGGGNTTAGAITGQQQVPLANAAQGVGLIPSMIQSMTAPAQAQLGAANTAYSQPYANLMALLNPAMQLGGAGSSSSGTASGTGSSVGNMTGTGTSTTTQPQSTFSNILGGLAGGAGILSAMGGTGGGMAALAPLLMLSDSRTKENVEEVGELDDGQPVVRFNYRGSDLPQIGLLAQEVRKTAPHAVHDIGGGILAVDYRAATQRAAEMRKAA